MNKTSLDLHNEYIIFRYQKGVTPFLIITESTQEKLRLGDKLTAAEDNDHTENGVEKIDKDDRKNDSFKLLALKVAKSDEPLSEKCEEEMV